MSVLQVSNIGKSFGGIEALRGVSFTLNVGEILAMIGPNGAGKSTCFNCINGQIRPDVGSIHFHGQELGGLKPRSIWRLGVGRTFQITATFSSMTVSENVQMALISYYDRTRAIFPLATKLYTNEAIALLEAVGMADQASRPCNILAYGDLKRVELAVALANKPSLLLMDEPTAGMAPQERIELMRLTSRIVSKRRISVLFTEHDMDVVFTNADRIIVLNRGEVIAEDSPESIRENPLVKEVYLGAGSTYATDWAD